MSKTSTLYLVAAIAFAIASVFSFVSYFTETHDQTQLILGCATFTLAIPMTIMYVRTSKEKS